MAGKLKALDVEREDKPGKYADGDGLYLLVAGPSAKNWSYRYWFKDKERWRLRLLQGRLVEGSTNGPRCRPPAGPGGRRPGAAKSAMPATKRRPRPCRSRRRHSRFALRRTSGSTGQPGAKSIAINGPRPLSATPTIGHLTITEIKPSHIYELLAVTGLIQEQPCEHQRRVSLVPSSMVRGAIRKAQSRLGCPTGE